MTVIVVCFRAFCPHGVTAYAVVQQLSALSQRGISRIGRRQPVAQIIAIFARPTGGKRGDRAANGVADRVNIPRECTRDILREGCEFTLLDLSVKTQIWFYLRANQQSQPAP
jgi:hypothetical protein